MNKQKIFSVPNLCVIGMLLTVVFVIQDMNNLLVMISAPVLLLLFAFLLFDDLEKQLNDGEINDN